PTGPHRSRAPARAHRETRPHVLRRVSPAHRRVEGVLMQAAKLAIEGALKLQHDVWRDERGLFLETWNERELARCGLEVRFVQDNLSVSRQWTVRGLHYQIQQPQGKLVRVLTGKIYAVIVDLRRTSPTFG